MTTSAYSKYFKFTDSQGTEWKIPLMGLFAKYLAQEFDDIDERNTLLADIANAVPWKEVATFATKVEDPEMLSMQDQWDHLYGGDIQVVAYELEIKEPEIDKVQIRLDFDHARTNRYNENLQYAIKNEEGLFTLFDPKKDSWIDVVGVIMTPVEEPNTIKLKPTPPTTGPNWVSISKDTRDIITDIFKLLYADSHIYPRDLHSRVMERNGDAVPSQIEDVIGEMLAEGKLSTKLVSGRLVLIRGDYTPITPHYNDLIYAEIRNAIIDPKESTYSFSVRDIFNKCKDNDPRYTYEHFTTMIEAMVDRGEIVFCSTARETRGISVKQFRKDGGYRAFTDTPVLDEPLKVSE